MNVLKYIAQDTLFVDNTSGYVGIGTSAPNFKLDVDGNLSVTESVYIGTGTEWLSIYLDGITGFFDSIYPIKFTQGVNISGNI